MREIYLGLKNNLDVSYYANPIFDKEQMKTIRYGLADKIDVSIYAKLNIIKTETFYRYFL